MTTHGTPTADDIETAQAVLYWLVDQVTEQRDKDDVGNVADHLENAWCQR